MREWEHGGRSRLVGWEIDHIKPVALDGTDDLGNATQSDREHEERGETGEQGLLRTIFHREKVEGYDQILVEQEVVGFQVVVNGRRRVQFVVDEPARHRFREDDVFAGKVYQDVMLVIEGLSPPGDKERHSHVIDISRSLAKMG